MLLFSFNFISIFISIWIWNSFSFHRNDYNVNKNYEKCEICKDSINVTKLFISNYSIFGSYGSEFGIASISNLNNPVAPEPRVAFNDYSLACCLEENNYNNHNIRQTIQMRVNKAGNYLIVFFVFLGFMFCECSPAFKASGTFTLPFEGIRIFCSQGQTLKINIKVEDQHEVKLSVVRVSDNTTTEYLEDYSTFFENQSIDGELWLPIENSGLYQIQLEKANKHSKNVVLYELFLESGNEKKQIKGILSEKNTGIVLHHLQESSKESEFMIQINVTSTALLTVYKSNGLYQTFYLNEGQNEIKIIPEEPLIIAIENATNIPVDVEVSLEILSLSNKSFSPQPQNQLISSTETPLPNRSNVSQNPTDETENSNGTDEGTGETGVPLTENEDDDYDFLFHRTAFWVLSIVFPVVFLLFVFVLVCYWRRCRRSQENYDWQPAPPNYFDFLQSAQMLNVSADSEATCSVCLENECNVTLACGHAFHINCIQEWVNRNGKCPNCRKDVVAMYNMQR